MAQQISGKQKCYKSIDSLQSKRKNCHSTKYNGRCCFTIHIYRDELVHGFILVYSSKRRASLANLSALSVDIPELPLQILAVTEHNGQSASAGGGVYMNMGASPSDSLSTLLISEGSNLADRLNAHFMTSTTSLQQKSKLNYMYDLL